MKKRFCRKIKTYKTSDSKYTFTWIILACKFLLITDKAGPSVSIIPSSASYLTEQILATTIIYMFYIPFSQYSTLNNSTFKCNNSHLIGQQLPNNKFDYIKQCDTKQPWYSTIPNDTYNSILTMKPDLAYQPWHYQY